MSTFRLRYLPALLCFAASGPAAAAVEWFATPKPGEPQHGWSSHVGTWAQADGPKKETPCSFAVGNPPQPLTAWFKQFGHCKVPENFARGESAFFSAEDRGFAAWSDPASGRRSRLTSVARQDAWFDASYLLITAAVETRHSGEIHTGKRSMPRAWGEVYFRVPDGPNVRMSVTGSLSWEGSATAWNGRYQALWIANTLRDPAADHINFGFHPLMVEKGTSAHTLDERTHWLSPGVYMISWSIHSDVNDAGNFDSKVKLTLDIGFGEPERCPDPRAPATPVWPRGTTYAATVTAEPARSNRASVPGTRTTRDTRRRAPECVAAGPAACWEQEKVNVYIRKDGVEKGPYEGWRFLPGTLTRDPAYPLQCDEIDPRFNCHGYSFAAGTAWLEQEAIEQILRDWCLPAIQRAPGEWRAGDIRVFRDPARTERDIVSPIGLEDRPLWDWFDEYLYPDHSGTLLETVGAVDEKLGLVVLQRPAHLSKLTRTEGIPEYYRCRF